MAETMAEEARRLILALRTLKCGDSLLLDAANYIEKTTRFPFHPGGGTGDPNRAHRTKESA